MSRASLKSETCLRDDTTVSFDFKRRQGDALNIRGGPWDFYQALAREYGWTPLGTTAPRGRSRRRWNGGYNTNDGQEVTQTDAIELAKALRRALADPRRQEKEAEVVRKLSQSIKDFFFQDTGEWLSDEEASGGLELHEEFVRKLVAFLDGGAFFVW